MESHPFWGGFSISNEHFIFHSGTSVQQARRDSGTVAKS